ncbi:MAG: hypothetical protein F4Y98_06965, partial [Chloroflexi bacterium]|nr:hypothetical protein [Chloroflexota bacterium]
MARAALPALRRRRHARDRAEPPPEHAQAAARRRAEARAGRRFQRRKLAAVSDDAIRTAAVVGTTAWGTTLAVLLARNGVRTTLLARDAAEATRIQSDGGNVRRLPDVEFPAELEASADPQRLAGAQIVCFVVQSQTMAANARAVAEAVPRDAIVL